MKGLKNLLAIPVAIAGFLLVGTTAKADPITFTLNAPFQPIAAGGTATFDATITNSTGQDIFLNGDSTTLDALLDPSDLSDADYDTNFPLSLSAGQSVTDALFTVAIPLGTPGGIYAGSFDITGGSDSSDQSDLGSQNFNIDVIGSGTVVPEPSSLVLFISGMAGLTGIFRRRPTGL